VYFFKNLNLEVTLVLRMLKNPQPEAITKSKNHPNTLIQTNVGSFSCSKTFKEITNGFKGIRHMDP
jgi:hypothetical protein